MEEYSMSARLLLAALLLFPAASWAQGPEYDRPVAIRTVKAADTELRCTSYPDLTVREVGTDTPAPGQAVLIPGSRPACSAERLPNQVTLPTSSYSFAGRRGPYLIFSATDPNGAVPFKVMTLTGAVLYSDSMAADQGIHSVAIENNGLHLRFTRSVNADCSLRQGAPACWSKLIAAGKLPRVMANASPSSQSCAAAYQQAKATPDDPSIVSYDVDMTIGASGKAQVKSRGPVSCDAMP